MNQFKNRLRDINILKLKSNSGSMVESQVADYFVFSYVRVMGSFRLDKCERLYRSVRKLSPKGYSHLQVLEIGEKLQ